jgi:hypothetical protein
MAAGSKRLILQTGAARRHSLRRKVYVGLTVYLGTLKIANRLLPKLNVFNSVPTNTRLRPFTMANLQPCPAVIRSPLRALSPLIVISAAMLFSFLVVTK